MKLLPENIEHIRFAFSQMKNNTEFIELLDYANKIMYNNKAMVFSLDQLNKFSNAEIKTTCYTRFIIKKRSGDSRTIHAPKDELKALQRTLNLIFQALYDIHPSATGFVWGKSIVNNANLHFGKYYVFNIDLSDFFPSITQYQIFKRLQSPPFNLNKENSRLDLATLIADLCCHENVIKRCVNGEWTKIKKSVLPQGAPTSPTLSNFICNKLDLSLNELANKFGLIYSRYADDITFSSFHNIYHQDGDFKKELYFIVSKQSFTINERKTRLQTNHYRQEVTGLIVNEKVNVPSRYLKKLRMWLYLWEHYGYDKATEYFIPHYLKEKKNLKEKLPQMDTVIDGKLNYLKMVKGETDRSYRKLKERYDNLKLTSVDKKIVVNPVESFSEISNKLLSDITKEQAPTTNLIHQHNSEKMLSVIQDELNLVGSYFNYLVQSYYQAWGIKQGVRSSSIFGDIFVQPELAGFRTHINEVSPKLSELYRNADNKQSAEIDLIIIREKLREAFALDRTFTDEIEKSVEKYTRDKSDMTAYRILFQVSSDTLYPMVSETMSIIEETKEAIHNVVESILSENYWEGKELITQIDTVRKFQTLLGFSKNWIKEFTYYWLIN